MAKQRDPNSFVALIRLERETNGGPVWRGHVRHVQGDEEAYFQDLTQMSEFLERVSGVAGPVTTALKTKPIPRTTTQRLGGYLLSLTEPELGRTSVRLGYGKRVLAGRLGMRPESLSRSLNKLRKLGVTERAGVMTIRDISRLRDFCFEDKLEDEHL